LGGGGWSEGPADNKTSNGQFPRQRLAVIKTNK